MSHPDPVVIHDHVYIAPSAHVAACADCAAAAERLQAERRALREALSAEAVEPPADLLRRRKPWPMLAAAAALLALLGGLLFFPLPVDLPAAQDVDLECRRLAAELRSPFAVRREIALVALRAYGAKAYPAVAEVDPKLAEEFRTPSADDVEKEAILGRLKKDYSFENVPAVKILETILADIPLPSSVERGVLDDRPVTFKVKDLAMKNVLKLLLSQFGLDYHVLDGRLLIGPPRVFMISRLPVRVGAETSAAELIRDLAAGDLETRQRAQKELRTLDFSAEKALWTALDAPDPEAVGRAADLLRALYTPAERLVPVPARQRLDLSAPVTLDVEEEELPRIVDLLRDQSKLNIHLQGVTSPDRIKASFRARGLTVYAACRLLLDPLGLKPHNQDFLLLLAPPLPEPAASPELGPFWMDPANALAVSRSLARLDAPDVESDLIARAAFAVGPLRAAGRRLEEPARSRARALLPRIYKALDLRLHDDPPGGYREAWTEGTRRTLERRLTLDVEGKTLPDLLRQHGLTVKSEKPDARTFTIKAGHVSVAAILDALTRTEDLDWRMDGETVVLDSVEATRAAAER